ncbi:PSD1 and planctomycete cytochrome C domain-containing protein [Candidatus Laterigemmans baculatus]|uniref:PSD1 and planctomycete cytochrome C domain-containing protein n=1 Tax=Candidatus Laterigemmans baculatus TaxID=2770505 RepID=UPI0013DB81C8|nr:PSD1 and planctomycete cytochrome C domain-containing protein [Candidatus Laterigemmans baculatus]
MSRWYVRVLFGGFVASCAGSLHTAVGQETAADRADATFFETRIRPVLAEACVQCHGPDVASGELRLDSREALLQGGEHGPAVVPGDPERSLLILALKHDDDQPVQMPPEEPLSDGAIADLTAWIAAGAKWPKTVAVGPDSPTTHWAFQPLADVPLPEDPTGWGEDPIDRFVSAARHPQGLRPNGPADKHVLLRRAYYDLIGLPPTAEQVEAFVADDRPEAFAAVIDELLASPRYGERWGRYWLDLVRYADTAGDNSDYPIPQAYLYRDYVVDAFNADVPYDRFLHEQLAGDLLAREAPREEYERLVIATGFIAQAKRMGTRELEDMHIVIEDTLATVGPALLGLSLRCARCHDHKFEPLSQHDYYALYGIFASTQYPFPGAEEVRKQTHFAPLIPADELRQREEADSAETIPTAYAVSESEPLDAKIQKAGNPSDLGEAVPRGVPRVLDPEGLSIAEGSSGRLELARWLTTKADFLTARVMANRLWQFHFGKPLVATPSDFGYRGTPPTHPQLLDWLANEFIASGWSMKEMHRKIMLSKTYQMSTEHDAASDEQDTGNRWYWRFERRRLDAEAFRDTLLTLGGTLDLARPGPHPFPEPSKWKFTAHHQFNPGSYPSNHRSVYLMVQRLHAHPFLSLFNGADPSLSTAIRDNSALPQQGLFLFNNELVHEQAAGFAQRLIATEPQGTSRLQHAYLSLYARPPSASEQSQAAEFLERYEEVLAAEGIAAEAREFEAWSALVRTLLASNELMYVD